MAVIQLSNAQDNSKADKKTTGNKVYTSLKPNDVQPAVFSSKEEYNAKFQDKKDRIITLITNENDSVKVIRYREELWRLENAIIQEPRK